ncbi:MAG: peptidylprolyl isomerase [Methylococcales bacterium]
MNKTLLTIALSGSIFLIGCKGENGVTQPLTQIPEEDIIAKVNGTPIGKKSLEYITAEAAQRNRGAKIPEDRLLEDLISRELLSQEAERKQLQKKPDVTAALHMAQQSILSKAAIGDFIENTTITDAQIQAEYDTQVGGMKSTEYKARHILSKTEEDAKTIVKQLDKGANFAELAKEKSTGPSNKTGGDLGWFTPDRMVPLFSEAVIALKKNEYTKVPVKTQFGWHTILREDSRQKTPPKFEEVKEQVKQTLQRKALQDHLTKLRSEADVVIVEKKVEEPPAAAPASTSEVDTPPVQTPASTTETPAVTTEK